MKIKVILLLMAVAVMSSCHSDFEDDGKVKYLRFGYIEGNIGDSYVNLYICKAPASTVRRTLPRTLRPPLPALLLQAGLAAKTEVKYLFFIQKGGETN